MKIFYTLFGVMFVELILFAVLIYSINNYVKFIQLLFSVAATAAFG
jgi:hypothetical protein